MAHLLVVEDDEKIGAHLESGLRANGYEVTWCLTGGSALERARSTTRAVDLVLLDLGLPDIDGLEICREIRLAQPAAVIVMLTARTDEIDVVAGLESGADDYLTKPFGMVELLARVRAHLRRGGTRADTDTSGVTDVGDVVIDRGARRCLLRGNEILLRAKEFDLLARLAESTGAAVSRETLMTDVWDENWWGSTKTLDVHIAALRRKLAEAAATHGGREPVITTLRGHGYRLEPPPAQG